MSIGGTITGGTTGSVLFVGASSVLAQDNANLFWDDTNNRLGIGTATPANTLDILSSTVTTGITIKNTSTSSGNTRAVVLLENNSGSQSQLFKTNSTYTTYKTVVANDLGFYNGTTSGNISILNDFATGNINFAAGGSTTPHLTIASTGAITSSNNITVSKNGNQAAQLVVSNTTSGTTSVANLTFTSDASSGNAIFGKYSSTTTSNKIVTASNTYIYNATAGDIAILNDFASGTIKFAAGGASTAQAVIKTTGQLQLNNYTSTSSFTGTAVGYLGFDSSGNILSSAAPSGGGISWSEVTGTTQSAAINTGYIANNASQVVVTLPTTAAVGSVIEVVGKGSGGWKIAQGASQLIHFGNLDTTTGATGYLASTLTYDAIRIVCTVANTTWTVLSVQGNISVV